MGLTDLQAKKSKPQGKRYELNDGNGLYLRITANGKKTWVFRYQLNNRPRRLSLGRYPDVGIVLAREKHAEARADLAAGIDPGQKAQEKKQKRKAAPTFKEILDEIWDVEMRFKKSGKATYRIIEKDCMQPWGNKKIADIKRRDIVLLLDRIRQRSPIMGNRVHGALTGCLTSRPSAE